MTIGNIFTSLENIYQRFFSTTNINQVDMRVNKLSKAIHERHLTEKSDMELIVLINSVNEKKIPLMNLDLSIAELNLIAPHLHYVDCRNIAFKDTKEAKTFVENCSIAQKLFINSDKINHLSQLPETLQTLDCSNCPMLKQLDCSHLPYLREINCSNCSELTELKFFKWRPLPMPDRRLGKIRELDSFFSNPLKTLNCSKCSKLKTLELDECPALQTLNCSYCDLMKLDCRKCTKLKEVDCSNCPQLKTLELRDCPALQTLNCSYCDLMELKLSNYGALKRLDCSYCQSLQTLDCSTCLALQMLVCNRCPHLKEIDCSYCFQLKILKLDECQALEQLNCSFCDLIQLKLSNFQSLQMLICNRCTHLTEIDCSNCSQLKTLEPGDCPALQLLNCSSSNLTQLKLSNCQMLKKLDCSYSKALQMLDCRKCPHLREIDCSNCPQLKTLDPGDCPALQLLNCSACDLVELNLSNYEALKKLVCSTCLELQTIDCRKCPHLTEIDCSNCFQLKALEIDDCPALERLNCSYCDLMELNLSNSQALQWVNCSYAGALQTLDCSNCRALRAFDCSFCPILETIVSTGLPNCRWLNHSECYILSQLPQLPPEATVISNNSIDFVSFMVDPEELKTNPLQVLCHLGEVILRDKRMPNIVYLNSPGLDHGGLRRQLVTTLMQTLFKKNKKFLPHLAYKTLGALIALAALGSLPLGRFLKSSFFYALLHLEDEELKTLDKKLAKKIQSIVHYGVPDEEIETIDHNLTLSIFLAANGFRVIADPKQFRKVPLTDFVTQVEGLEVTWENFSKLAVYKGVHGEKIKGYFETFFEKNPHKITDMIELFTGSRALGVEKIKIIVEDTLDKGSLFSMATCFQQVKLPPYDTYDVFEEKLLKTIEHTLGHFGKE